jgi:hypothetical protein
MSDNNLDPSSNCKPGYPESSNNIENIPEGLQLQMNPAEQTAMIQAILIHEPSFYEALGRYSRILKVMSWIDSFVCILFYLSGLSFLIFLLAFPITGYCAAKYYHKALITGYMFYLILVIICRSVLIGIFKTVSYAIVQGFIIAMELFVFIVAVKFYRALGKMSKDERRTIRMIGQGYVVPSAEESRIEPANK